MSKIINKKELIVYAFPREVKQTIRTMRNKGYRVRDKEKIANMYKITFKR